MGKYISRYSLLYKLWICRKLLTAILTPLVLLPLLLHSSATKASSCGYVMCLMGVYWGTETLPIAITGTLPIFLLPMLDLLPASKVCGKYMKDILLMFMGGIILAFAVEKVNLHKRIALNLLLFFGTNYKSLITGFGFCSWFFSMWLSNTATITLILPIVEAVIHQIQNLERFEYERVEIEDCNKETTALKIKNSDKIKYAEDDITADVNVGIAMDGTLDEEEDDPSNRTHKYLMSEELVALSKALTLCVGYNAKIGGLAMLTGTPVNLLVKSFADDLWLSHGLVDTPLTFATWTIYALPTSFIFAILVILWLQLFYLGPRTFVCKCKKTEESKQIETILRRDRTELGPMRYAEVVTLVLLVILVCLWFFLDPGFIGGWKAWFTPGYISGAVPSMLIAVLLFIIPIELTLSKGTVTPIMDWPTVHKKMPWMVILIFGGGAALAEAALQSGLSTWIGNQLLLLASLPNWVMLGLICLVTSFVTEIIMNSAAIVILLPVVTAVGENIGMNPLYLAFPVSLAAQFAFMLPTSSISTTLIISTGRVAITDTIKAGFMLNIIGTVVVLLATHTWGMVFFDMVQIPWLNQMHNMTTVAAYTNMTNITILLQ